MENKKFKPLEEITKDNSITFGKVFLIKTVFQPLSGKTETIKPYFYGGEDTYIGDGSAGIEKGEKIKGIRIFNNVTDGKYNFDNYLINSVFWDEEKGLLLPSRGESIKREYSNP